MAERGKPYFLPSAHDFAEHLKHCRAKPGNCPFLKAAFSAAGREDEIAPPHSGESGTLPSGGDSISDPESEYAAVVARYTNPDGTKKRGWMHAPNGKSTRLTERQWVQVRTHAFKAWFGDWEAEAEIAPAGMAEAKDAFATLMSGKTEVTTADGARLRFVAQSSKAYSKAAERESSNSATHWAAVANIEDIIARSRFMFEESPRNGSPDIAAYVKHGAVFTFGGEKYIAKITSKRYAERRAQNFYSVESVSVEKIAARGIHEAIANGRPLDASDRERIAKILDGGKGASRVVDENGEPLVVYRGSPQKMRPDFEYGHNFYGDSKGFWFTNSENAAKDYAFNDETGESGEIKAVYLNARNIMDLTPLGRNTTSRRFNNFVRENFGIDLGRGSDKTFKTGELYEHHQDKLYSCAHDAIKIADVAHTYIVKTPDLIKSATDNTDAFSTGKQSILDCAVRIDPARKVYFPWLGEN